MEHYEYEPAQRTWGHILEDKAAKHKDKVFVYFRDEQITYGQLNENVNRVANGYLSLGVKKGDKVAIMMPNWPGYLYHWFGLGKIGAVDVAINWAYKGDLLRHVISISGAKMLVVHQEYVERVKFIEDELPSLEKVIVYSTEAKKPEADLKFPTLSFDALLDGSPQFTPPWEVKPSDPLMVIFTSGTTGPSKGAVLCHNTWYLYSSDLIRFVGFRPDDITYNFFAIFHANHRLAVGVALLNGASYIMGERFSASRFLDEVRKYKPTVFHFLGGVLYFIYAQPPRPDDADNSLRMGFGGPLPRDIGPDFEKRFGVTLHNGYFGMTEASGITLLPFEEAQRLKAEGKWAAADCGRAQNDRYEVKLVDDDDNEVPVGQAGEIVCRPARPHSMMSEYINNPEATVAAFRNLWFHSGDLGQMDEHGHLYFVDRKKDYIRRRGENISSFEVEKVINSHPAVLESAAVGVKSEVGEEEIKVVIRLKEGQELSPEELLDWCEPRMAQFMIPRYIEFKEALPKTPTDRIEKYKLRTEGLTDTTWDREQAGYKIKKG